MDNSPADRARFDFAVLDVNGNGVLEASDFDALGARVVRAATWGSEAQHRAIEVALRRFWTAIVTQLDRDHDGVITFDEWAEGAYSNEVISSAVEDWAAAQSALGDVEGNGLAPRSAFVAVMTAMGYTRASVEASYEQLKLPDSEYVAVETWKDAARGYFDPATPNVFGSTIEAITNP